MCFAAIMFHKENDYRKCECWSAGRCYWICICSQRSTTVWELPVVPAFYLCAQVIRSERLDCQWHGRVWQVSETSFLLHTSSPITVGSKFMLQTSSCCSDHHRISLQGLPYLYCQHCKDLNDRSAKFSFLPGILLFMNQRFNICLYIQVHVNYRLTWLESYF